MRTRDAVGANTNLSAKERWEACPDGSWMAWMLGRWRIRQHLAPEALTGLREWAMTSAHRAITVHAPNALLSAAACHPEEAHRTALIKHAEGLSALSLVEPADASYAADPCRRSGAEVERLWLSRRWLLLRRPRRFRTGTSGPPRTRPCEDSKPEQQGLGRRRRQPGPSSFMGPRSLPFAALLSSARAWPPPRAASTGPRAPIACPWGTAVGFPYAPNSRC